MRAVRLLGLGTYRPATSEDSAVAAERCGTDETWVRTRSGIERRGVAGDEESVADMGVAAGGKALAAAGVDADAVGLVLAATCSTPHQMPGTAPTLAARLGASEAGATDVVSACSGFSYAVSLAADTVRAGTTDTVLVVASERMRDVVDLSDRGTGPLFGDGAGAVVVGLSPDGVDGVSPAVWRHDGAQAGRLDMTGEPLRMDMDGRAVYRWASETVPVLARRACERAGVELADLAAFVPHQANLRITDAVVRALRLPASVAVGRDVVDSGNTSAASVPLALGRLVERGEVGSGDLALLVGFGAGLTACAQVVRCP